MTQVLRSLLVRASLAVCVVTTIGALRADGPALATWERFYESAGAVSGEAKLEGGDLLIQELNCVACHQADGGWREGLSPRQAPRLDDVGNRVRPEWLRAYLSAPHKAKPGAAMPDLFAGVDGQTKIGEVEALVHFLASTGTLAHGNPIPSGVARGEQLFHKIGCVACHDPLNAETKLAHSVPLPTPLSAKYTVTSLIEFLKDPRHARPSGRMPSLNLNQAEALDVASYLLRDIESTSNLTQETYEGSFSSLAQLRAAKAKSVGPAFGFSIDIGKKNDFGLRFDGRIKIPKVGKYEFSIASDDGSALSIDGKEIVNADGIHPKSEKKGSAELTEGLHSLTVEYFQQGGEQALELFVRGPGLPRIPLEALLHTDQPAPDDAAKPEFAVDRDLAKKGAEVFANRNCVACHAMKDPSTGQSIAVKARPPKLTDLNVAKGCLAPTPQAGVPNYDLRPTQRALLSAAVATVKDRADLRPAGENAVHRQLVTFNCYACHQRGELGGVVEDRSAWFASDQPEMGDEGRIPPTLTGVGDKLNPEWLTEVVAKGSKERPYMLTRMPRFGGDLPAKLTADFVALDQKSTLQPLDLGLPPVQVKAIGRHLVGGKALSCIKCHTFDKHPATGIQAISLSSMTKRLRQDWTERYLLDPQQYRPGTRMPAPWPNGQTFYPDLLDGSTQKQIRTVWEYLSDGTSAAVPLGLEGEAIELIPVKRPIIYRNFIEGAGVRAIGVGYPEKAHLAFDADELAVRLIWQNAFIDAAKHWVGRGPGFQPPLGDAVLKFEGGAPAARLENDAQPWPKEATKALGWKFEGYRLDEKGRPTFLYRGADAAFEDFPQPQKGTFPSLLRRISVDRAPSADGLRFRALRADAIEKQPDGSYRIDGAWTLAVTAPGEGIVRDSDGKKELLVPLPAGESKIELHYRW